MIQICIGCNEEIKRCKCVWETVRKLEEEVKRLDTAIVTPSFVYGCVKLFEQWKELQSRVINDIEERLKRQACDSEVHENIIKILQDKVAELNGSKPKPLIELPPRVENCNDAGKGHGFSFTSNKCVDCGYEKLEAIQATTAQELDHVQSLLNKKIIECNNLKIRCDILKNTTIELRQMADDHFNNAKFWHQQAEEFKRKYEEAKRKQNCVWTDCSPRSGCHV